MFNISNEQSRDGQVLSCTKDRVIMDMFLNDDIVSYIIIQALNNSNDKRMGIGSHVQKSMHIYRQINKTFYKNLRFALSQTDFKLMKS